MSKICIWCRKEEPSARFRKAAHIFPQSLGGKRTCTLVCDDCNLYFGSKQAGLPSVEIALKEPLNISRLYLYSQLNKGKKLPRFKSEYFEYDLVKHILKPKNKYSLISQFQQMFTQQFKRGVYKIWLEERSESVGDALSPQFDFIREFARYGLGDYPVYYCEPNIPAIFVSTDLFEPVIRFTEHSDKVMKQYGFYSYSFITHELAFPVIRTHELMEENYIRFMLSGKDTMYSRMIPLKYISDLDFIFSYAN